MSSAIPARVPEEQITRESGPSQDPLWVESGLGRRAGSGTLSGEAEAIRRYRDAADRAPRWGALHLAWGRALEARGRRDQAREKYGAVNLTGE